MHSVNGADIAQQNTFHGSFNDHRRAVFNIVLGSALYTLAYLGVAALAQSFKVSGMGAWYPAPALAVILIWIKGYSYCPTVFATTLISNLWLHPFLFASLPSHILFAALLSASSILIAGLLRDVLRVRQTLDTRQDMLRFLLAALVVPLFLSVSGGLLLVSAGFITWEDYPSAVFHWCLGSSVGLLVIVPFVMLNILPLLAKNPLKTRYSKHIIENLLIIFGITLVILTVFLIRAQFQIQMFYLVFLPLVWVALNGKLRRTSCTIFVTAVASTLSFVLFNIEVNELENLQIFLWALAISGLVIGVDAAERTRAQNRLKETHKDLFASQQALRRLIHQSPVGVQVFDTHGRCVDANQAHLDIFGVSTEQIINKYNIFEDPLAELVGTQEGMLRALNGEVVELGDVWFDLHHADPRFATTTGKRVVKVTLFPIVDELQNIVNVVAFNLDITHHKQTEEAMLISETRYRRLFNNANDAIFVRLLRDDKVHTPFIEVNDVACKLLGYTREEFSQMTALDITHNLDTKKSFDVRNELLNSGNLLFERTLRAKDGRLIQVEINSHVFIHNGENVLMSVARDITERKRAQANEYAQRMFAEALSDTAAALNSSLTLDTVLDRILTLLARVLPHDAATVQLVHDDKLVVIRHTGYSQHGLSNEKMMGLEFPYNQAPLIAYMINAQVPVAVPDVEQYSAWHHFDDGLRWIRSYVGAPLVFQDKVLGVINLDSATPGTFTNEHARRLKAFADQASIAVQNARYASDLEQRVAERTAELDQQRQQIQFILDTTAEGIVYAEDTLIRYANQALLDMLGYKIEALLGQKVKIMRAPAPDEETQRKLNTLNEHLLIGKVWRDNVKLQRADGTIFDAGLTVSLMSKPGEQPIQTVTIIRDISQEKALEALKARFIANAAHELSTPITSLSLRTSMLRNHPQKMEEHLHLLELTTERLKYLVEDMLDISRLERGVITLNPRSTPINALVADVMLMCEPEASVKRISLVYQPMAGKSVTVLVDTERMAQVFTNLLSNAIHYTPQGGQIEVTTITNGDYAIVSVHDNGSGIASADLPFIFQPFFRSDQTRKGTGLGLSIAKELVELHNGEIKVESERGKGSTFSVILPLAAL